MSLWVSRIEWDFISLDSEPNRTRYDPILPKLGFLKNFKGVSTQDFVKTRTFFSWPYFLCNVPMSFKNWMRFYFSRFRNESDTIRPDFTETRCFWKISKGFVHKILWKLEQFFLGHIFSYNVPMSFKNWMRFYLARFWTESDPTWPDFTETRFFEKFQRG